MSKKTPQAFLQSQRQMPQRIPLELRQQGDWHELHITVGGASAPSSESSETRIVSITESSGLKALLRELRA